MWVIREGSDVSLENIEGGEIQLTFGAGREGMVEANDGRPFVVYF